MLFFFLWIGKVHWCPTSQFCFSNSVPLFAEVRSDSTVYIHRYLSTCRFRLKCLGFLNSYVLSIWTRFKKSFHVDKTSVNTTSAAGETRILESMDKVNNKYGITADYTYMYVINFNNYWARVFSRVNCEILWHLEAFCIGLIECLRKMDISSFYQVNDFSCSCLVGL